MQQREMPESRVRFVSGLVGGMAALALPLAALADPPLEKFKKDEVRPQASKGTHRRFFRNSSQIWTAKDVGCCKECHGCSWRVKIMHSTKKGGNRRCGMAAVAQPTRTGVAVHRIPPTRCIASESPAIRRAGGFAAVEVMSLSLSRLRRPLLGLVPVCLHNV